MAGSSRLMQPVLPRILRQAGIAATTVGSAQNLMHLHVAVLNRDGRKDTEPGAPRRGPNPEEEG